SAIGCAETDAPPPTVRPTSSPLPATAGAVAAVLTASRLARTASTGVRAERTERSLPKERTGPTPVRGTTVDAEERRRAGFLHPAGPSGPGEPPGPPCPAPPAGNACPRTDARLQDHRTAAGPVRADRHGLSCATCRATSIAAAPAAT